MWNVWQPIHGHLHLTSHPTSSCVGLVVCGSCQPCAHIVGDLWPECRVSTFMDCIPGLPALSHEINETCEEGDNPLMAADISYHNPHPGNGLIVWKSCKILAPCFGGLWSEWRVSISISQPNNLSLINLDEVDQLEWVGMLGI